MKKVLSFICFIIGLYIISITVCGCKNTKKSYSAQNSTTTNTEASEQEMIISIDDIVEFQNLMEGCSGLTNQAKSNYQKARPSIEVIAKRNGFTIYEYHYINGDLGDGEMSSYCCYLYKNCTINKSETGYPTFTPSNNEVCCVLSDGEIIVYDKDSYDELVRQVKEKCEDKLYSETEGDGEESHYYSDGKYCYYMDWVGSGEYRIPIRKQVDENSADNSDGSSFTQYSDYVGTWRLNRTESGQKMRIEVTLKENHSGELVVFHLTGSRDEVLIYEEYPQCKLTDGVIYLTKNGDITRGNAPKLKASSDGLYSFDNEKYVRESK